MTNSYVIRNIRYTFDLDDDKMMQIFASAGYPATRAEVCNWLKKEDDPEAINISDKLLALFLNGFIDLRRGKKEGAAPEPEKRLNNNIIFRKLRIALNLKDEDIIPMLADGGMNISKHELSALFRKPDHIHYRECQDQLLRNFLQAVQLKFKKVEKSK